MITSQPEFKSQLSNGILSKKVLEEVISQGINEFCLCPGGRNAPLLYPLVNSSQASIYYWPEERSAAFFALGRIKATGRPAAVVTTSGSAAAEVLPAVMEAYYTGLPLVIITADRPRRFRGTGAPQSVEQVGLYHCYAHEMHDLAEEDEFNLNSWERKGPLHLNICFEEPKDEECRNVFLAHCSVSFTPLLISFSPDRRYLDFLGKSRFPFVIVGSLHPSQHESAVQYLLHLGAPVYVEGISGLREDRRLDHLRITWMESIWQDSALHGYPIDGIIRLGGIPTIRMWRDIEHKGGKLPVCSISDLPFSGLSCADVITVHLTSFFEWAKTIPSQQNYLFSRWRAADHSAQCALQDLFHEEPQAEQSLIRSLTKKIPFGSKIYLGNSLPIREWDLAAIYESKGFQMSCSRGVNGIDGQISTFLGYSTVEQDNWAILGDLTVIYDLAGPWITSQVGDISTNVVAINNGGAGIFKRMFSHPAFLNTHSLSFEPFAEFWKWSYERWESIPDSISSINGGRLIELIPNAESTERFSKKLKAIEK